jgi:hypothetical protein
VTVLVGGESQLEIKAIWDTRILVASVAKDLEAAVTYFSNPVISYFSNPVTSGVITPAGIDMNIGVSQIGYKSSVPNAVGESVYSPTTQGYGTTIPGDSTNSGGGSHPQAVPTLSSSVSADGDGFSADPNAPVNVSGQPAENGTALDGNGALAADPQVSSLVLDVASGQDAYAGSEGKEIISNIGTDRDADGSGPVTGIALAMLQTGGVVTAGNFAISGPTSTCLVGTITNDATAGGGGRIVNDATAGGVVDPVSINDVSITEGNSGTKLLTFTVTRTGGTGAFTVDWATANSTASTGWASKGLHDDYQASSGTLSFGTNQTSATISVTIIGDTYYEPDEKFFVNLTNATNGVTIDKSQGVGTILNDDPAPVGPHVVAVHDLRMIASGIGSWDPDGICYDPVTKALYLVDSEVDEEGTSTTVVNPNNMWALNLDGTLNPNANAAMPTGAVSLYTGSLGSSYTNEPTGIAIDPATGNIYISDDDVNKVFVSNLAHPTQLDNSFSVAPFGGADTEDIAFNPNGDGGNGSLYIANGADGSLPRIMEFTTSGQHLGDISLPSLSSSNDLEAICYDATFNVFFVGIEQGHYAWMLSNPGVGGTATILETINLSAGDYRSPINGGGTDLKGMTIAPSSTDPSKLSLYLCDYGWAHVSGESSDDGRLWEVANPFYALCFMPGTLVRCPQGDVAVEALKVGDLVLTTEDKIMPIRWIGRQTVSLLFADELRALPIRIRAGALAENVPVHDLLVSPDHAILVDEVLVQAGALVNGTSIIRETNVPRVFTYYHVELDDHSLILAENVPAETFIDNVDRMRFDNWEEHEALYPEGKPIVEMPYPRAKAHRQVSSSIRTKLEIRAKEIGSTAVVDAA